MRFKVRTTIFAFAVAALLASAAPLMAQHKPAPNDPIVLLLKGPWLQAVNAPNLGLAGVNLNDGTWLVNEIHTVTSVPGINNQNNAAHGHVYVQTTTPYIAYDLPGGVMLMEFKSGAWSTTPIPDGHGGLYYQEDWDLTIDVANGIYSAYQGGHNHMVDRYDALNNGSLAGPADESCYCIISVGGGLPLWWTSN